MVNKTANKRKLSTKQKAAIQFQQLSQDQILFNEIKRHVRFDALEWPSHITLKSIEPFVQSQIMLASTPNNIFKLTQLPDESKIKTDIKIKTQEKWEGNQVDPLTIKSMDYYHPDTKTHLYYYHHQLQSNEFTKLINPSGVLNVKILDIVFTDNQYHNYNGVINNLIKPNYYGFNSNVIITWLYQFFGRNIVNLMTDTTEQKNLLLLETKQGQDRLINNGRYSEIICNMQEKVKRYTSPSELKDSGEMFRVCNGIYSYWLMCDEEWNGVDLNKPVFGNVNGKQDITDQRLYGYMYIASMAKWIPLANCKWFNNTLAALQAHLERNKGEVGGVLGAGSLIKGN